LSPTVAMSVAIAGDGSGDAASVDSELPEVAAQGSGEAHEVQVGRLGGCHRRRIGTPLWIEDAKMPDEVFEPFPEACCGDYHVWTYASAAGEDDVCAVKPDHGRNDIDRSPLQRWDKVDVEHRNAGVFQYAGVHPSVRPGHPVA